MYTSSASKNKHFLNLVYYLCLLSICLPLFTSCASTKTIVNSLDEKEANEIIVYLSGKGIDAAKVQNAGGGAGGSKIVLWDIVVDASQATEAMSLLNQIGLPRRRGQSLLNIFAAGGLVPSELQEKIRYQAGLAEQIASTIRKIDGVLDAEVQISFPEEDPLNPTGEKKQKITSSVYVKHSGVLDDPNTHLVTKIKRLVAASITGLDYDNVTVIGDRARYSGLPTGEAQGSPEQDRQFVTIWTLILAKDSVFHFRILFFSFIVVILLLILTLIWLGWKLYPILHEHGGIKELFHIHPIRLDKTTDAAHKPEEGKTVEGKPTEGKSTEGKPVEGKPGEVKAKKEEEGKIDQDLEEG